MKLNALQKEIRLVKEAFEKIAFVNIEYDLDEIVLNLESSGVKPNPTRTKIFGIIAEYMMANNQCLPSDLEVLQQLVGARKGWGYLTQPMIWQICQIQDPGYDYQDQVITVITDIVNTKVIKHGNLRFLFKNDLKRSFLNDMLNYRKDDLAYQIKQINDPYLSVKEKEYFGYRENIQNIQKQIEELEKALQFVA